jgi:hypothetical protein
MIAPATVDMALIVLTRALLDIIAGRDPSHWTRHLEAVLRETAPKDKP